MVVKTSSEFEKVLKECSEIASTAFMDTNTYQKKAAQIVKDLHKELSIGIEEILQDQDTKNFEFSVSLEQIIRKIEFQTEISIEDLTQLQKQKKKSLNTFTISLFGRTKAGKSTIREALTKGDGKTIGKGNQRTTQDILEYSWKGLRLLDVPGIEAFRGEEDTQKAHDIIDQSDMIVFLTSDDSVQPGEFDEMAKLKEVNKDFFVVMNVKKNLLDPETAQTDVRKINRFIRKPERVFDMDRLKEHRLHVQKYVKEHMSINYVDVIWIHAQAAYLSTKNNLGVDADLLWDLSKLDTFYERVSHEINRYGKHRRVLTFFDSLVHFVDTIEKMMWEEQKIIRGQAHYMLEKRSELKKYFDRFIPESNRKMESRVEELFIPIKQWVPSFVEEYIGENDSQQILQKKLNENIEMVQESMEGTIQEIVGDLQSYLSEFTRQYQYDIGSIQFESNNIGSLKKGQMGKILKWGGKSLGGVASGAFAAAAFGLGAANVWNPVGWIALGASAFVGIASWLFGDYEKKKWMKVKKDAKQSILNSIDELEAKTKKQYKAWFYEEVTTKGKRAMFDQVSTFIEGLFGIANSTRESAKEMGDLKDEINKLMFCRLLQLEGVACDVSELSSIAREQGIATKILVPSHWNIPGSSIKDFNKICGENVYLISKERDIRNLVAKALHHEKVSANQVTIQDRGNEQVAIVNVPSNIKGLLIGKNGNNIRLAKQLCGINILIDEE